MDSLGALSSGGTQRGGACAPFPAPYPSRCGTPSQADVRHLHLIFVPRGHAKKAQPRLHLPHPSSHTHHHFYFCLLTLGDTGAPSLLHPQLFK